MNTKTLSIVAVVLIIVAGGSFYGGVEYQKSQSPFGRGGDAMEGGMPQMRTGQGQQPGNPSMRGGFASATIGEIIAKDESSITVKLTDGGSRIVLYSANTSVSKNASGSVDDLSIGTYVTVTGENNQDGSVSAEAVRIGEIPTRQP